MRSVCVSARSALRTSDRNSIVFHGLGSSGARWLCYEPPQPRCSTSLPGRPGRVTVMCACSGNGGGPACLRCLKRLQDRAQRREHSL